MIWLAVVLRSLRETARRPAYLAGIVGLPLLLMVVFGAALPPGSPTPSDAAIRDAPVTIQATPAPALLPGLPEAISSIPAALPVPITLPLPPVVPPEDRDWGGRMDWSSRASDREPSRWSAREG